MRFLKVIAIVLAFGLIFAGCSMVEVNAERDRETVIAKVGDEVVLKGEFQDVFSMYKSYGYFEYYPEDFDIKPEHKDYYKEAAENIISSLVDVKVAEITAREKGCFDFTAEEQAEIDEQVSSYLNVYAGMYAAELKLLPENSKKTEEELTAIALENIDIYLAENNFGLTKQSIREEYENTKAQDKLFEMTTSGIEVTEDEVKEAFDVKVESEKNSYEQGTANFEQNASAGETLYFVPENVRKAQHILIQLPTEDQDAVNALLQAGDNELAEIKLKEVLMGIEDAANAAYERAVDGEDFELLMEELGQDPGMESYDYYVVMNPTLSYVVEFAEGLFALKNIGDITEPIATNYGYHIIKYYDDMESGPVAYDDVRDDIYNTMLDERRNAHSIEQMTIWSDAIEIKTYVNRAIN